MNDMTPITTTLKDWETDQEVRWCPGCGDYAILSAVQSVFPELGVPREKFVISPNSPVRQIWISALVKSFKLDWSDSRADFVLAETGQSLSELLTSLMQTRLGAEFSLEAP